VRRRLRLGRQRWQDLESHLRRMDLRLRLSEARGRHQAASARISAVMENYLRGKSANRLGSLSAQLHQLSPLNVLQRGYAIVQDQAGHVVKSAIEAPVGTDIQIRLAEGRLKAEVK
jgi:exodeoxyribonuclease VII large subunit